MALLIGPKAGDGPGGCLGTRDPSALRGGSLLAGAGGTRDPSSSFWGPKRTVLKSIVESF